MFPPMPITMPPRLVMPSSVPARTPHTSCMYVWKPEYENACIPNTPVISSADTVGLLRADPTRSSVFFANTLCLQVPMVI